MNTHEPTREPLDENEREFARVVRALPGGEPSASLDARILKAAQDAVAAAPSRRARSWAAGGALWGIGSAAAAVLAIGVGWQVLAPPSSTLPVPATCNSSAPGDGRKRHDRRVQGRSAARVRQPPPPPPEAAAAQPRPARAPMPPPPPPAAPPPTAMEAPSPFIDEHVAANSAAAASDAVASAESDAAATAAEPALAARSSGLVGKAAETESRRERAMDQAVVGAAAPTAVAAPAPAATRPASQAAAAKADYRGKPANWLAHIRQLRDAEDLAGARESLRNFKKRYPDYVIPTDLAPLLRE